MAIQEQTVKQSAPFFAGNSSQKIIHQLKVKDHSQLYKNLKIAVLKRNYTRVIFGNYSNHLYLNDVRITIWNSAILVVIFVHFFFIFKSLFIYSVSAT
ncbi:hypothetical protein SAMN06295933_3147 [Desulfovibrio gilichinskyi]|uniref:Uncharacterized protein n=1 Tax=Desulfovibrio gilichinskyi TaxID=1519643 RepID=A0A1X7ELQ3_9BACT|nr:hypothetical protein SAMN06295933_3147 [Desulfovibrio gilichinskyi]